MGVGVAVVEDMVWIIQDISLWKKVIEWEVKVEVEVEINVDAEIKI